MSISSRPSRPYRAPDPPAPKPVILTTAPDIPGHRITQIVGIVEGSVGIETAWTAKEVSQEQRKARGAALDALTTEAREAGADAVIVLRYDSTERAVSAYGTAVRLERI